MEMFSTENIGDVCFVPPSIYAIYFPLLYPGLLTFDVCPLVATHHFYRR